MTDYTEKVLDAFRNCVTKPKCRDCPWESCEKFNGEKIQIPADLALEVMKMLWSAKNGGAEWNEN